MQKDPSDPFSTTGIMPLSVISQAEGKNPTLGRHWRLQRPAGLFIGSVGGNDDAPMVFEFLVPKGALQARRPLRQGRALRRVDDGRLAPIYTSQSARDDAIRNGSIAPKTAAAVIDWSHAFHMKGDPQNLSESNLAITNVIPFRIVLQSDILKGLGGRRDQTPISGGGLAKFEKKDLASFGTDSHLQVRKFAVSDDTQIVQITVDGCNKQFGFLADIAASKDPSAQPLVVDMTGQQYFPIGYVYRGAGQTWIYFNPQAPIQSTIDREMPTLSRSQPDQELVLIFRVSKGVKLKGFAVGPLGLLEFNKPEPEVK